MLVILLLFQIRKFVGRQGFPLSRRSFLLDLYCAISHGAGYMVHYCEKKCVYSKDKVVWNMYGTRSFSISLLKRSLRDGLWGDSKEVRYRAALPFKQR